MFRSNVLRLGSLVGTLLVLMAETVQAGYEGQLYACSAMARTLTVRRSDLTSRTFRVADGCSISARGKSATLADLKIGDHVFVDGYGDLQLWGKTQNGRFPTITTIVTTESEDARIVGVRDPSSPGPGLSRTNAAEPSSAVKDNTTTTSPSLSEALDKIKVPQVAFTNRPFSECVAYIRDGCAKVDKKTPINLLVKVPPLDASGEEAKISLSLQSVTAWRLLQAVCDQADVSIAEEGGILTLSGRRHAPTAPVNLDSSNGAQEEVRHPRRRR